MYFPPENLIPRIFISLRDARGRCETTAVGMELRFTENSNGESYLIQVLKIYC